MSAKCNMCGKMTNKYHTTSYGDTVCYGVCLKAYCLEAYLLRLEERRKRDEANNTRAYQQAREIAAWLSVWKCGNEEYRKKAAKVITAW